MSGPWESDAFEALREAAGKYVSQLSGVKGYEWASPAALAAELRQLKPPPPPEWFPALRELLADVAQEAGFTYRELSYLPNYITTMRREHDRTESDLVREAGLVNHLYDDLYVAHQNAEALRSRVREFAPRDVRDFILGEAR